MSFTRKTGHQNCRRYNAAGTIAVGDAVQFDENGEVVVCATNKAVLGVALTAATSATDCLVDIAMPGDQWEATVSTGTMAAAEVGEEADFEDENSLTLTESNNDFLITGWDGYTTTKCIGQFMKTAATTIAA